MPEDSPSVKVSAVRDTYGAEACPKNMVRQSTVLSNPVQALRRSGSASPRKRHVRPALGASEASIQGVATRCHEPRWMLARPCQLKLWLTFVSSMVQTRLKRFTQTRSDAGKSTTARQHVHAPAPLFRRLGRTSGW